MKNLLRNIKDLNKIYLVFLIVLDLLFGCTKKNKVEHDTIPTELKQWYLFQKGSYWIYNNDKTQKIDSSFINKIPEVSETWVNPGDGPIVDDYSIYFENSFIEGYSISPFNIGINSYLGSGGLAYMTSVNEGKKFFFDNVVYEYVHYYDSLLILNKSFHDVRYTKFSEPTSTDSLTFDYYFSKYIGLIKFSYSRGGKDTTWNLLRWHVIQ
jgi:hypothetical protein